ncbi:hypothetical protein AVEN_146573-1 [Araneus ventricosus]|uniref:Uncharacterized protein n=1 Tax=Araneus ventricosus TaxID=182803 RepID=A0A4Y2QJF9_ARAVE|nr:hypothetical protein AVEN_146573-1 [Araneus ventricosus]
MPPRWGWKTSLFPLLTCRKIDVSQPNRGYQNRLSNLNLSELTKDYFIHLAVTEYVPQETIQRQYFNKSDELSFPYVYFIKKK